MQKQISGGLVTNAKTAVICVVNALIRTRTHLAEVMNMYDHVDVLHHEKSKLRSTIITVIATTCPDLRNAPWKHHH